MITFSTKIIRTEINGQSLEFEDIFSQVFHVSAIDESDAQRLFHKTKELFDEAGIKFALVFGSLLGAVREGRLIPGDQDMDICVWDEEKLRDSIISIQGKGLKICRMVPGLLYSFMIDDSCYIDVYILREFNDMIHLFWKHYCISLCGWETPRKFFAGFEEITFFGEKCLCPKNPEGLLEFWYGPDWRIPQQKKGNYRLGSFVLYERYVYKLKALPKKCLKLIFSRRYRQSILKRKRETGSFFA